MKLGGSKQRSLLAFLLLNPNQAMSRDRLIDERRAELAGATELIRTLQSALEASRRGHAEMQLAEVRVFRQVHSRLCRYGDVTLVIEGKATLFCGRPRMVYSCASGF